MKKLVMWALCTLCMVSFPATAQGLLNSQQSVEIKASMWKVWDAVKDFDALEKKFSYKVIDPTPLPLSDYVSTVQIVEGRRGYTTILWRSSFRNNSDGKMKDEEVIGFIDGAYRAGLDNLKIMLESK